MDLVQLLGRNVRAHRQRLGLTQEALAFDAGMKRSYLVELEAGKRNPSVRAVERLSKALGVRPAQLLEDGTLDACQRSPKLG
jgi:transcriptional regulator with XRE-family HTH domain